MLCNSFSLPKLVTLLLVSEHSEHFHKYFFSVLLKKFLFFMNDWKESFEKFERIQICCGFAIFHKIDFPQFTLLKMPRNEFFIHFDCFFLCCIVLFLKRAFSLKTSCCASSSFFLSEVQFGFFKQLSKCQRFPALGGASFFFFQFFPRSGQIWFK